MRLQFSEHWRCEFNSYRWPAVNCSILRAHTDSVRHCSITLTIVPTILIVVGICIRVKTKEDTRILPIYSKAGALAEEVFSIMRIVHAFWLQPLLSKQYDELLEKATTIARAKFTITVFCSALSSSASYVSRILYFVPVLQILVNDSTAWFCGYSLAFWQGIWMYTTGEIAQSGTVVM